MSSNTSTIYLRTNAIYGSGVAHYFDQMAAPVTGTASFTYSLDNKSFVKIGDELKMMLSLKIFAGNKFCLINYATKEIGGYLDFDWFRTSAVFYSIQYIEIIIKVNYGSYNAFSNIFCIIGYIKATGTKFKIYKVRPFCPFD